MAAVILKMEKSPDLRNCLTDRHEIWHDDTGWPFWPFRPSDFRPEVEISQNFTDAHWKMTLSVIMDSTMRQIPRLTERISSFTSVYSQRGVKYWNITLYTEYLTDRILNN